MKQQYKQNQKKTKGSKRKTKIIEVPLFRGRYHVGHDLDFRYQGYPECYRTISEPTGEVPNYSRLPLAHDIFELCHLWLFNGSFNYPKQIFPYLLLIDSVRSSIESHGGRFFARHSKQVEDERVSYYDIFHRKQGIVSLKQDVYGRYHLEDAEISVSNINSNLDGNTKNLISEIRLLGRKYKNGGFVVPEIVEGEKENDK